MVQNGYSYYDFTRIKQFVTELCDSIAIHPLSGQLIRNMFVLNKIREFLKWFKRSFVHIVFQLKSYQKMQQLLTTKRVLILLCLCPADNSTNKWKKIGHILFALVIFVLILCFFVVNVSSTIKFLSINLQDSLFAFVSAVGIFALIYTMVAAFLLRHRMGDIFEKLSKIEEKCGYICVFLSLFDIYF